MGGMRLLVLGVLGVGQEGFKAAEGAEKRELLILE